MNSNILSCPVCVHGNCDFYSDKRWIINSISYQLLLCHECRSIFTHPLPSEEALKQLYATSFDFRWYRDHNWAKNKDCIIRIKEYEASMLGRILDYGGGVGYFSAAARKLGYECTTYDPYANSDDIPAGSWNTVVALHVLEHSNNIDRTVSHIHDLLVPGGTLIVAVPNASGRGYEDLGMDWVWAQPPQVHIFHFTAPGLSNLLQRHGFTDIRIDFHDRWDANLLFDLKYHAYQKFLDSLWGIKYLNRFWLYRKLVSHTVSRIRYMSLLFAKRRKSTNAADLSELVITSRRT